MRRSLYDLTQHGLSRLDALAPEARVSRWVFLRLLGLIYLIAFLSLGSQLLGLVGSQGILPADPFLHAVRGQFGLERYWLAPTLCWFGASDAWLRGFCVTGGLCALLLLLDVAPALMLTLLWATYLSLTTVCRDFLGFQWDNLLLEAGFLAIFLSPLRWRPAFARDPAPSRTVVWLLRWLLFRLMFSSGVVKLASGDATWRHLTALTAHFETQPLPTWMAWYAHQLPVWLLQAVCLVMFGIELIVPFLIFGPRRLRLLACSILIGFQLLIMATGNYAFFNLLTIALCLLLLDDAVWPTRWSDVLNRARRRMTRSTRHWPWWVLAPLTVVVLVATSLDLSARLFRWTPSWAPIVTLERAVAPFRTLNSYGLFAVMTTSRQEIVVEGSQDGITWLPYEFRDKPGDPYRRPRVIAPHQPRLDWQMWFAALGSYQDNPWFLSFCGQLLRGSPEVLRLLDKNPFPHTPPRYLRALMYEYHFTDGTMRRRTGLWWRRELKGFYCPTLSLQARE